MKHLNKIFMMTAAMIASCPNSVYYTGNYKDKLKYDTNNYKANEKVDNKILREYKIKGKTIMAYSKKDAIKRLKHSKL